MIASTCARPIYIHHKIPDKKYIEAGRKFPAVVQIHALDMGGRIISSGSGTWVQHPRTGIRFILTASHVLEGGSSYRIVSPSGYISIRRIEHLDNHVLANHIQDYVITISNPETHERLMGARVSNEPDLREILRGYGLDLAIAFVDDLPGIKPLRLVDLSLPLMDIKGAEAHIFWGVGFGETGPGLSLGMPGWGVRRGGARKAFNPTIFSSWNLVFTNITNGEKHFFTLLGSMFSEKIRNPLEGQVAPGDSGGPLIQQGKTNHPEVRGVICSSLSLIHTRQFANKHSFWSRLLRKLGRIGERRSPLSYAFWQEGNVYGSQGHYIDLASPPVQQWLYEVTTPKPLKPSQTDMEENSLLLYLNNK